MGTVAPPSAPSQEWPIDAVRSSCATCGTPFSKAFDYHAVLALREGALTRLDHCIPCWTRGVDAGISHWQGRHPAPPDAPSWIAPQNALEALHALGRHPEGGRARILLALLLVRRKVLHLERIEPTGPDMEKIVLRGRSGEPIEVVGPRLSEETLSQAKQELTGLLFSQESGD
ncbi:MAG: hypothetical protein HY608_02950, partial [Planctomycetes bacterium]|nr:hypothetical protein [Planctomycetota bacterium]